MTKKLESVKIENIDMVNIEIRNVSGHAYLFLEDGRMLRGQLPTDHYFYVGQGKDRQATFRPQFLVEEMSKDAD